MRLLAELGLLQRVVPVGLAGCGSYYAVGIGEDDYAAVAAVSYGVAGFEVCGAVHYGFVCWVLLALYHVYRRGGSGYFSALGGCWTVGLLREAVDGEHRLVGRRGSLGGGGP